MESTWEPRDLPVLDAVVRHFDEHPRSAGLRCEDIASLAGLDPTDVERALRILAPTYVRLAPGLATSPQGVTDEARRAVGQWPSPELWADHIIRALQDAAEREPDDAKRTRLRAAADALGGFGRDLLVSVIANVATKPIGS